jgi:hypothetical protein
MKKIFTIILFSFLSLSVKSQELPKYYINKGDTIGLTLGIPQIKRIKKDLELKEILEKIKSNCDSIVLKSKNQEQEYLDRLSSKDEIINQLDTSRLSKIEIIQNLNRELTSTVLDRDIQKMASIKKDSLNKIIKLKLEIAKQQRNRAYRGTLFFFISTIMFIII